MKVYKIINNSVAQDLISKDGMIKANKELGAVSLAPNLRSLWMWGIELCFNSLCPVSFPDKEDTIFIAEVELPDDMVVDFCEDAYDLESASWEKVPVSRTGEVDIDGWQYPQGLFGSADDDAPVNYGTYPEIRVKECRVNKLYKIDKRYIKEASKKLPYYLMDQGMPDTIGIEIEKFKKELDNLKNYMVECSLDEAFDHIEKVNVLTKEDIYTDEKEISVYFNKTPMIGGILGKMLLWSLGATMIEEPLNNDLEFFPLKWDGGSYHSKNSDRYNNVYIIKDDRYVNSHLEIDEDGSVEIRGPYDELTFTYNIYKLSKIIDVIELLNITKSYITALRVLVALMNKIEITFPAKELAENVIELVDVEYSKYIDMNTLYLREKIINVSERVFAYKTDIEKAWEKSVVKKYEEYMGVIKNHPYFFDDTTLYKIKEDIPSGDHTAKVKIETWWDEYNYCEMIEYILNDKPIKVCIV